MSVTWSVVSSKHATSVASVASDPFATSAGDVLVLFEAYRDADQETFGTPVVAGATVGPWQHVDAGAILDSGSSRYVRLRVSTALVTVGDAATTVTSSTGASVFNLMQRVAVAGGVQEVPAQSASGTGTAKPAALSFPQATTEGNLAVAGIVVEGFDVTAEALAPDAGWTDDGAVGGTPAGMSTASRTTGVSGVSWNGTGLTSGKAHSEALIELAVALTPPMGGMMAA